MTTLPLVILGAGGFARETLDVVDAINAVSPTWNVLGFIVDGQYGQPGTIINDKPILGDFSWLEAHRDVYVVCGVGAPEIRYQMIRRVHPLGNPFASLIHPNAVMTRWITLGAGIVITAGCILTNQVQIKDHVHLNLDCTIGHDAVLDPFVTLAPGAHISGNVHVQEGAYIGTGANIIEKKVIGAWSVVGAGATVIKNVPANSTVVGVPAQVVKQREAGWHLEQS